jgi:hypothetical protein
MTLHRLATLRRTSTPTRCAAAGRAASCGRRFGRLVPNACPIVAPFLSALSVASDPAAGEVEVLAAHAGELGGSEPGLHRQQDQRVVMPPDRSGAVGRGQKRVDLGLGEVADQRRLVPFVWDREHPRDLVGALRCLQRLRSGRTSGSRSAGRSGCGHWVMASDEPAGHRSRDLWPVR